MSNFLTPILRRAVAPIIFGVLVILISSDSISAQTKSAAANRQMQLWKAFAPEGMNFQVSAPLEMKEFQAFENEHMKIRVYKVQMASAIYFLAAVKLVKPVANFEMVKELAEDAAGKLPDSGFMVGEAFISSHNEKFGSNLLAGEAVAERNGNIYKSKRFLTRGNFFFLQVITPDLRVAPPQLQEIYQAEAAKFFNSFQILDNKGQGVRGAKGTAKK